MWKPIQEQLHLFFTELPEPPGAPEAPVVDEVFPENCQVAWQPPAEDGGAPITGYHVERRITSSQRWIRVNKVLKVHSNACISLKQDKFSIFNCSTFIHKNREIDRSE